MCTHAFKHVHKHINNAHNPLSRSIQRLRTQARTCARARTNRRLLPSLQAGHQGSARLLRRERAAHHAERHRQGHQLELPALHRSGQRAVCERQPAGHAHALPGALRALPAGVVRAQGLCICGGLGALELGVLHARGCAAAGGARCPGPARFCSTKNEHEGESESHGCQRGDLQPPPALITYWRSSGFSFSSVAMRPGCQMGQKGSKLGGKWGPELPLGEYPLLASCQLPRALGWRPCALVHCIQAPQEVVRPNTMLNSPCPHLWSYDGWLDPPLWLPCQTCSGKCRSCSCAPASQREGR